MRIAAIHGFIVEIEDLLPPELCRRIVERFDADPDVEAGRVVASTGGRTHAVDKCSRDLGIEPDGAWGDIFAPLHTAVSEAVHAILPSFPGLQVHPLGGTGYKIQLYPKGSGYFRWHFDALGPDANARVLALILYCNDVAVGGETAFHHQGIEFRPRAGRALLFPTSWTHMHCGRVPESDDKVIVSSFFELQTGP